MGYVATKGGETAIREAARVLEYLRARAGGTPVAVEAIRDQLHLLTGRVISEGGLYDPDLAALALKQSAGDTLEAAFYLRAFRSTRARLGVTEAHDGNGMRLIRRISSAFKEIPGGQMLGPTPDYLHRLFRFEHLAEGGDALRTISREWLASLPDADLPDSFPKVVDALRAEGLLPPAPQNNEAAFDITRDPLVFPVNRSAALATMSRAETGSMLGIAYSNMRGYGDIHPTVAELRVGYVPLMLPHPITGEPIEAGEVLVTECEVVAMYSATQGDAAGRPVFSLGYGACFGHNEVKAISMAILDRALQKGIGEGNGKRPDNPSEDPEFVLLHIDGVDSMGFCTHYKMPHYVTFQSDMDRLRSTREKSGGKQ
ncbi:carbon-phosphorus lyase complex subunit PhnI [Lacisediminimonas sp.]|uniref:carbon-phosphorus lyase complex subunit PhnI n=1 Tax=Lacisediminimonas sp. TaxID=3060582 RepID=UPI002721FA60|nr:carbon-phosphorus lyase complex subunit PhnI [Lacisediminimonas sp.]MDO8298239.1 carbon-phosphorus lyase complex subunit PhnI [Lacisediminimonas sp.]